MHDDSRPANDRTDDDAGGAPDDPSVDAGATDHGSGPTATGGVAPRAQFDVPGDASPSVCTRCGRPFPDERPLALHRVYDHPDAVTDAEREAAEAAYDAETDELRRFRLLALGGVVLLYFGFLFAYAVFG